MVQKILFFRFIIFALLFLLCSISYAENRVYGFAKVIDGDTIHIGKNKIRLYGIDAPEHNQRCTFNSKEWTCGLESTLALRKIINNNKIECKVVDRDRYNRLVAICFLNDININKIMVNSGWAIAYRYYSKDYIKDEEFAKKNKKGIWKGNFMEPYLFRKSKKN